MTPNFAPTEASQTVTSSPQNNPVTPVTSTHAAKPPVTAAPRRTRMSANMLQDLYEKVAKEEGEDVKIIPLNQPNDEKVFEDFKIHVRDELGKTTLAAQLGLMYVKFEEPDEVILFCPTEMSIIFANTQRDILLDFIKNQLKQFNVRVNVKLDPTFVKEVPLPEKPKSKLEIFNEMAERNHYILMLKKELNLVID